MHEASQGYSIRNRGARRKQIYFLGIELLDVSISNKTEKKIPFFGGGNKTEIPQAGVLD